MRLAKYGVIAGLFLIAQPVGAQLLPCPDSVSISHCDPLEYVFSPDSSIVGGGVIFAATSTGDGTLQIDSQGAVSYYPGRADVGGTLVIAVTATDSSGAVDVCETMVSVTNNSPTIVLPPNSAVARGAADTVLATGADIDPCDGLRYSLVGVTPQPLGSVTVDLATGMVIFAADDADAPGHDVDYHLTVAVSDGFLADTATMVYTALFQAPFALRLSEPRPILPGHTTTVAVIYDGGTELIDGMDLSIQFLSSSLSIQNVTAGSPLVRNGWSVPVFDTSTLEDCGSGCQRSVLHITTNTMAPGFALSRSAATRFQPGDTLLLIDVELQLTRDEKGNPKPMRWYWEDCNSNTLTLSRSQQDMVVYQSRRVFDVAGSGGSGVFGSRKELTGKEDEYPHLSGTPQSCDSMPHLPEVTFSRFVDFKNGTIRIICGCPIDVRGDLNLNGLTFEEEDLQLFIDYFTEGDSVFSPHIEGSVASSETNGDGKPLTVSDMVYMIRVIQGNELEPWRLAHERDTVTITQRGDDIYTDMQLGALHLVFEGETNVTLEDGDDDEHGGHGDSNNGAGSSGLLTAFMDEDHDDNEGSHHSRMTLETGVIDGNTHVLIYNIGDNQLKAGEILEHVNAKLLSADASDFNGSFVVVKFDFATDVGTTGDVIQPNSFELKQNYPNPFNPTTTIAFSLPKRSDVELSIYNMLGQRIRTLVEQSKPAGEHRIIWDGKDKNGGTVASGMYLYRLKAGAEISVTRKMVLLK